MTKEIDMSTTEEAVEALMPYAVEELDKMIPPYVALIDAQDEEAALAFLKGKFEGRRECMIAFAKRVYEVVEARGKDKKPATKTVEVTEDADTGRVDN